MAWTFLHWIILSVTCRCNLIAELLCRCKSCNYYSFLTSALDWVSGQCHSPAALYPGTHWIGGWVGLRARLDTEAKGTNPFPLPGLISGCPVCSQTDTRLTELPKLSNVFKKRHFANYPLNITVMIATGVSDAELCRFPNHIYKCSNALFCSLDYRPLLACKISLNRWCDPSSLNRPTYL
jgi:hypothetical protein